MMSSTTVSYQHTMSFRNKNVTALKKLKGSYSRLPLSRTLKGNGKLLQIDHDCASVALAREDYNYAKNNAIIALFNIIGQ